jgi:hypothetical protein
MLGNNTCQKQKKTLPKMVAFFYMNDWANLVNHRKFHFRR